MLTLHFEMKGKKRRLLQIITLLFLFFILHVLTTACVGEDEAKFAFSPLPVYVSSDTEHESGEDADLPASIAKLHSVYKRSFFHLSSMHLF